MRMRFARRQPVRIVDGRPEGGYISMSEIIGCGCGDHPDRDYRDVLPGLSGSAGGTRSRWAWKHT